MGISVRSCDGDTGGYRADKANLLNRLSRIEGQVRGVTRMVEQERYCVDVLTQISAAQAALDRVALSLLDDHVRRCVADAKGAERDAKLEELIVAIGRLLR